MCPTSSVSVTDVRKPPDVPEIHREPDDREQEVEFFAPRLSDLHLTPDLYRILLDGALLRQDFLRGHELLGHAGNGELVHLLLVHGRHFTTVSTIRVNPRTLQEEVERRGRPARAHSPTGGQRA